ncbi:acyltransferase [Rhodococcoides fascians]|uniref:acyltransferase n=1 Tax=Rhodococcoides fascians TaxID=1828 RepID=UPI0037891E5E
MAQTSRRWAQLTPIFRDFVLNQSASAHIVPAKIRGAILRRGGHSISKTSWINPKCFFGSFDGLHLGENTFVNYGCFFDLGAETFIGSNCNIGYQVMFVTCSHTPGAKERRAGKSQNMPIHVGDGVWIGARANIMPGVTIGDGCIIAANSLVLNDCQPNGLYAGIPAKLVRYLE